MPVRIFVTAFALHASLGLCEQQGNERKTDAAANGAQMPPQPQMPQQQMPFQMPQQQMPQQQMPQQQMPFQMPQMPPQAQMWQQQMPPMSGFGQQPPMSFPPQMNDKPKQAPGEAKVDLAAGQAKGETETMSAGAASDSQFPFSPYAMGMGMPMGYGYPYLTGMPYFTGMPYDFSYFPQPDPRVYPYYGSGMNDWMGGGSQYTGGYPYGYPLAYRSGWASYGGWYP
jgi:hypothetical protein